MKPMKIGRPQIVSRRDGVVTARIEVVSEATVGGEPEVELTATVRRVYKPGRIDRRDLALLRDRLLQYLDPT